MFSGTYAKVEEEAEEVSNYLQYELIVGKLVSLVICKNELDQIMFNII